MHYLTWYYLTISILSVQNISDSYSDKFILNNILYLNNLAYFILCAAYSLNLVGTHIVNSSKEAVKYFGIMQNFCKLFTTSTHRFQLGNT